MEQFPALNTECFDQHIAERLHLQEPPRILILYGSVRERSYSRFAAEEAGRLLTAMGAEVKLFNPSGLPSRMRRRTRTLRSPNYAAWSDGVTGWCGARRSGMGQ
jgi:Predicted flavoprotein